MKIQFHLQFLIGLTVPFDYLFCCRLTDCQRWKPPHFTHSGYEVNQYAKTGGEGDERYILLNQDGSAAKFVGPNAK